MAPIVILKLAKPCARHNYIPTQPIKQGWAINNRLLPYRAPVCAEKSTKTFSSSGSCSLLDWSCSAENKQRGRETCRFMKKKRRSMRDRESGEEKKNKSSLWLLSHNEGCWMGLRPWAMSLKMLQSGWEIYRSLFETLACWETRMQIAAWDSKGFQRASPMLWQHFTSIPPIFSMSKALLYKATAQCPRPITLFVFLPGSYHSAL